MAVSIEAAFVLLDKASGPLKKIQKQAEATDKALRGMGGGGGGLGGTSSKLGSLSQDLEKMRVTSKAAGDEVEKTGKKVKEAGNWFSRSLKSVKDWGKALVANSPALTALAGTLGGVVGGLKGMAGALPPLVWAMLAAAPVIVSLTGAIGALVSSLGAAVGGGALLGGGLVGSFAVGLGSIAAIAKPAIDTVTKYQKAVTALNTAIASGSPTAIRERQKELDAIAKANPGVAKLAGNLKSFQSEWKKATAPGRADFFKLANDGIQTMRKLLPTLASEANKNTGALQQSFQKILAPFLQSSAFKGMVTGLGGIFRANLPGFATGIVNIFKGLAEVLKVLTPQLDRAGPSFEKFTGQFAKWAGTASGQNAIREMGRAFTAWLDLVKQIGRLLGGVIGAGMGPGTNEIGNWADKLSGVADKLSKPAGQNSLAGFFSRSLDDVNKLWPLMKQLVTDLTNLYEIFKPLGSVTQFVIKNLPAGAVTALTAGYLGLKGVTGAIKGATGVLDVLNKTRGSTPANPLYVANVTGGLGGAGEGGIVKKGLGFGKKVLGAAGLGTAAEAVDAGLLATTVATIFPIVVGAAAGYGGYKLYQKLFGSAKPKANVMDTATGTKGYVAPTGIPITGAPGSPIPGLPGQMNTAHGLVPFRAPTGVPTAVGLFDTPHGLAPFTGPSNLKNDLNSKLNKPVTDATKQVQSDFNTMTTNASGSLSDMLTAVTTSTGQTYKVGSTNFKNLSSDIARYMASGALATQAGLQSITNQVNAALKGLGSKTVLTPLAVKTLSPQNLAAVTSGQVSPGAALAGTAQGGGHAGGGLIQIGRPGAAGQDTVKLNAGGVPIAVGEGEQVAVFNRHQAPIMNEALSRMGYGGLPGLFQQVNTPNYRATGGMVPKRFAAGGVVGAVNDFFTSAGFDKIAIAGILGNAMQESSLNPNAPGGGMWQQISNFGSGTGGSLLNQMQKMLSQIGGLRGSLNAADSPGAAASIFEQGFERAGIPAMANRVKYAQEAFAGQLGAGLTGGTGTGTGTVPLLVAPTVTGAGSLVPLTQRGLSATVAAANAYLQAHSPTVGVGGGAGPVFPAATGPIPAQVQWAQSAAQNIAGRHPAYGHMGAGWGLSAYDCSSYVSTVMDAAGIWPKWAYYTAAQPINAHTDPGPGKYITIGTWGTSGQQAHTMMEINGQFFESGGRGGGGPHVDSGWSQRFDQYRHPHGFATGGMARGVVGEPGYQPTAVQAQVLAGPMSSRKRALMAALNPGVALGAMARGGVVPWFGRGADFIANRPTVIGVGDTPGERVTVTPKGAAGPGGVHIEIHKIEVHRKGDIQKIVDEELALLAATLEKHA